MQKMTRKAYPSDVTNAEWQIIERLLPNAQGTGRPRQVDLREIINGIFYVVREGCSSREPYRMTYHLGKPYITTFGIGSVWECGRKFTHNCDNKCEKVWKKQTTQQQESLIVSR
jgi:hypothetical protein